MKKNCSSFPSYLPEGIYEVSMRLEIDTIIYTIETGPLKGKEVKISKPTVINVLNYSAKNSKWQVLQTNTFIKE